MILRATSPRIGEAVYVCRIKVRSKVYFLVDGPGNVRWGTNKAQLETPDLPGVNSGLLQNALTGEKEREWQGEIWVIADTASVPIFVTAPVQEWYDQRGKPGNVAVSI